MHILQPKHTKLKPAEAHELLAKYNSSLSQLPKIRLIDPSVPQNCQPGDILKIERKEGDKINIYYRVVA
jgi:DNA-directed RNA polymerase subunit H (RpoH/RPB5)